MEHMKTPEHASRIRHFGKKFASRYKAEEAADAEFVLKWRKKQKKIRKKT